MTKSDCACYDPQLINNKELKVAIVHYWLVQMRGGEKVLEALCRMYPQADIYTHVCQKEKLSPLLQSRNILTTFIQSLPFAGRLYQMYLPLMPLALEQLDLTSYDLVISCESGPAKGVLTRSYATHICYCHSPMRYLWDFYPQYLASASILQRIAMRPLFFFLRQWDVLTANRVDFFVANSNNVRRRIKKHWNRSSDVVHPPVEIEYFPLSQKKREDFYLCVGQLIDYKRVDLAIQACLHLKKQLIIIGDGKMRSEYEKLMKKLIAQGAPDNLIIFKGRLSIEEISDHYSRCSALLFPGEEDFGIVPLEAMATGAPVIAYGQGGATETIIPNQCGLFFAEQNVESICKAIEDFEKNQHNFKSEDIRNHAIEFSEERFAKQMFQAIEKARQIVAAR